MYKMAETSGALPDLADSPDFSHLPDVAWVKILSYLPLADKAKVARMCHTLNNIFSHPSLWHTVKIILLGHMSGYNEQDITLPVTYLGMVKRFGPYFQDLTLIFHGYCRKLPTECALVIQALSKSCRLESLTLKVVAHVVRRDLYQSFNPVTTDLDEVATIVSNAYRLHEFTLKSWPMYPNLKSINILDVLQSNPKIKNLERLKLFWLGAKECTWASLNVLLPSAEDMVQTVSHFKNLTHLSIRSSMLNCDVISELSKAQRTPLQKLSLLLTYSRFKASGLLPDIHATYWKRLTQRCPDLQVDITVVTRVPFLDLADFLKPEVPVSGISFMHYSRCDAMDLLSITEKYNQTLCKFEDYSDSSGLDEQIISLVLKCPKLIYLVYHGQVSVTTVKLLADIRNKQWYHFEMFENNILTNIPQSAEDGDLVVGQKETGEYFLVRNESEEQTEEERAAMITQLCEEVKQVLGRNWHPLTKKEREWNPGSVVVPAKMARVAAALAGEVDEDD